MTWLVEITRIVGDEELVNTVIESQGYQLTEQNDGDSTRKVLHHARFEELQEASAIRADAQRLSDNLSRFGKANDTAIGFTIGPVQHVKTDGQITKHITIQDTARISIHARAVLTFVPDPSISDEERRRREEEAEARAITYRRDLTIRRAKAALNEARVLDVMELLKSRVPRRLSWATLLIW